MGAIVMVWHPDMDVRCGGLRRSYDATGVQQGRTAYCTAVVRGGARRTT